MSRRVLIVPIMALALLVSGCGGSSSKTVTAVGGDTVTSAQASQPTAGASTGSTSGAEASSSSCPTSNTRTFAKTRFASDVGGSLFLMNRYVLKPYRLGKFTKGVSGRTLAFVKAGVAIATTAKLVKNATENAKANPTLCKAVSAPLTQLSEALSGLKDGLKTGTLAEGVIPGLSGLADTVKSKAADGGFPVTEQPAQLG